VLANALFLQSDAVTAGRSGLEPGSARVPRSAERSISSAKLAWPSEERSSPEAQALRIARFAAPGRIEPEAAGPADAAGVETVRAIQRELKLRGYGPVPIDGAAGLATRAAIMAFEHDHGMALSGEASEQLLKRIVLGAVEPANMSHTVVDRVGSPRAAEVIRSVQEWLAALGYQPGQINGRLGEDTVRAIREFEANKGLVPRGCISAALVGQLSEATTASSSLR
jgi:peptidoglycan hydrolase-like protein with peptidoglycan-binding domain